MVKPKLWSLQYCLGFIVIASLLAKNALAIKETIVFDPQIHKEAPGDDPDFTAVGDVDEQSPLNQKANADDINGALNFLADFAQFQSNDVAGRSPVESVRNKQQKYRIEQLRRQQKANSLYNEDDDDQEEGDNNNDEEENTEDDPQYAEAYLQSLLGRYRGEKQNPSPRQLDNSPYNSANRASMTSTTTYRPETTTASILYTKSPNAANLISQQQQQVVSKNAGGIDVFFIALLTCLAVAAALGVIVSIFCFVKIQKRSRSTQRFDYSGPGNGSGSGKNAPGSHDSMNSSTASAAAGKLAAIFGGHGSATNVDKKLANNATLYHFEHHKKEMMAAESNDGVPHEFGDSDAESGDENDENDYTVYECPGLAPTGEMQVDNPLFRIKQQTSQPAGSNQTSMTSSSAAAAATRTSPPVVVHGQQPSGSPPSGGRP